MKVASRERFRALVEMASDARDLVHSVERDAAGTVGTERDILETQLGEIMQIEDQILGELARQQRLRRLPPSEAEREQLWREYKNLRILGRRRMSARTKSRAIQTFGKRLYEAIPW